MAVEYAENDFYNKFSTDISYDTENRPTLVYYGFDYADPTGGNDATFIYDYSYNDDSTLSKLLIKQNSSTVVTITPTYDALSRVTTQTNKVGSATNTINYQFKANGSSTSAQVSQMTSKVGSTTTTYKYTYDENGNITEIANASGVIQNKYWYDDLGQLRREDNRATGRTYLFNYDNAGNIQYRKTYAFTTAGTATSVSTTLYSTDNYTYGNANWGDLLTAYKGTAISYDTIGNPLNYYNGYTFTWQKGRQLATATNGTNTLSFAYNADGIRTSKTVNGVKHTYLLSGSTIMAEYWQQSGVQHVLIYLYDNAGAPVGMMYRTNAYAADTYDYFLFEKNLQGDIVAVYNSSGTKLLSYTYDAWGNCTVTGSTTTGAQYNPFRYRGYYYDSELGLYYLNSRYYDASIGRFINADIHVNANQDLIGFNMFAYCGNNPISKQDPSGQVAIVDDLVLLGIASVAALIVIIPIVYEVVDTAVKETYRKFETTSKKIAGSVKNAINNLNDKHPGKYTVYALEDTDHNIRYIGRTKNLDARLRAHKRSKINKNLDLAWTVEDLTWCEARGLEQVGIVTYNTINAGKNSIRGISPNNPNRYPYLQAAWDYIYNQTTNEFYNLTGQ